MRRSIAVIGGGRWARVIAGTLCEIAPAGTTLSVHTPSQVTAMRDWVQASPDRSRVQVRAEPLPSPMADAVVVANAAHDHESCALSALRDGAATLVEKPVALSAAAIARLVAAGASASAVLAASHPFLFAGYLENFALRLQHRRVAALSWLWADPEVEYRYAEAKRYDASLPVYADCLPHICSMLGTLLPGPQHCEGVRIDRGGALVVVEIRAGGIPCRLHLERNAATRQRRVEVASDAGALDMEFSREPGTIADANGPVTADALWDARPRPMAAMLGAFLRAADGEPLDSRLSVGAALTTARVIDDVAARYRPLQLRWLTGRLCSGEPLDSDARYALTELLQSGGRVDPHATAETIERLDVACRSRAGALSGLAGAGDPAAWLRSAAGAVQAQ